MKYSDSSDEITVRVDGLVYKIDVSGLLSQLQSDNLDQSDFNIHYNNGFDTDSIIITSVTRYGVLSRVYSINIDDLGIATLSYQTALNEIPVISFRDVFVYGNQAKIIIASELENVYTHRIYNLRNRSFTDLVVSNRYDYFSFLDNGDVISFLGIPRSNI